MTVAGGFFMRSAEGLARGAAFNVHKFSAIAMIIAAAMALHGAHANAGLTSSTWTITIVTAAALLSALISGAMLNECKFFGGIVPLVHNMSAIIATPGLAAIIASIR